MTSYSPVTALLRGLEVLRVVNRSGTATVKEVHYETGLDKATIVRMLETLIHAGYLKRNAEAATYKVTGRVLQLSAGYVLFDNAGEICAPILSRLRDKIGWPSGFTIRDDDAMVVVQTSRDTGPISFNRNPGYRIPMLQTSIGKVYLAYCPDAEREEVLSRLRENAEGRKLVSPSRIASMLKDVRKAGFAVTDDIYRYREYRGTSWGMAVPVMDGYRIFGALNIMLLHNTVTLDQARDQYLGQLRATAKEIAEALRSVHL